jgi:C_GCAxxG_C_C family probable redox protein
MKSQAEIENLCSKAYELGKKYEKTFKGCGQCQVGAVLDTLELKADEVFKATTAFAGGIGLMGDGSCGAYVGGILLLGNQLGREKSDFVDAPGVRFKTYALAREYHDRFIQEYGTVTCRDIHMKIFGRPYFLNDKDEFARFEKAGGHEDKCPGVVGTAARWLVEILAREDLI